MNINNTMSQMRIRIFDAPDGAVSVALVMRNYAVRYHSDMALHASLSVIEVFELIKAIPYHADPMQAKISGKNHTIDVVQRPYYTLSRTGIGGDCDDKAVCIAAWAYCNSLPFRFIGVGRIEIRDGNIIGVPLHHVYPEVYFVGKWVPMDATYSENFLGIEPSGWKRKEVIG